MFFDADGDLAHEFYEENCEGRMQRVRFNLTPQVCWLPSPRSCWFIMQGSIPLPHPALNCQLDIVMCSASELSSPRWVECRVSTESALRCRRKLQTGFGFWSFCSTTRMDYLPLGPLGSLINCLYFGIYFIYCIRKHERFRKHGVTNWVLLIKIFDENLAIKKCIKNISIWEQQ